MLDAPAEASPQSQPQRQSVLRRFSQWRGRHVMRLLRAILRFLRRNIWDYDKETRPPLPKP